MSFQCLPDSTVSGRNSQGVAWSLPRTPSSFLAVCIRGHRLFIFGFKIFGHNVPRYDLFSAKFAELWSVCSWFLNQIWGIFTIIYLFFFNSKPISSFIQGLQSNVLNFLILSPKPLRLYFFSFIFFSLFFKLDKFYCRTIKFFDIFIYLLHSAAVNLQQWIPVFGIISFSATFVPSYFIVPISLIGILYFPLCTFTSTTWSTVIKPTLKSQLWVRSC